MPDRDRLSTWNAYQAAWSDLPDTERQALLESSVAPDCLYADAQEQLAGLDALVRKIERSQAARPGVSFRNDQLTAYGDEALSEWTMLGPDGEPRVRGASYARFGGDGRLTHMTGFFAQPGEDSATEPSARASTWNIYQASWARVSKDQRRTLLTTSVAEGAVYRDPAGPQEGREALAAYIDGVQQKTPGIWFRQTLFLEHHDQAFSRWERLSPDGGEPFIGASYARFAGDGRLIQMSGFPGSQPSVA